jgi:hypothetical protein
VSTVLHYANIDEYRILYSSIANELSEAVNELVSQGWSLFGPHTTTATTENSYPVFIFSQTMIKVEGPLVL